jgi:hypothetical protein
VVVFFSQLAKVIDQGSGWRQMRHLDRVESRLNDRRAEHREKSDALASSAERLRPGVTRLGSGMTGQKENLDVAMPETFAQKCFMHPNRFDVQRRAPMKFGNDALKRRDVPIAWGFAISNSTSHKRAGISWVTIFMALGPHARTPSLRMMWIYSRICTS